MNNNPKNTTELASLKNNGNPIESIDLEALSEDLSGKNRKEVQAPPLSWKELKSLKKSNYSQKKDQFEKSFLIQNLKTKMIVDIQASSVIQACSFIGWRPRHVKLIQENSLKKEGIKQLERYEENNVAKTQGSSV